MTDLVNKLRTACYLAYEDGTNDFYSHLEAANMLENMDRPPYVYIGKNGKSILARELEDQRDELKATLKKWEELSTRFTKENFMSLSANSAQDFLDGIEETKEVLKRCS